jgi:hypothetical protein
MIDGHKIRRRGEGDAMPGAICAHERLLDDGASEFMECRVRIPPRSPPRSAFDEDTPEAAAIASSRIHVTLRITAARKSRSP